MKNTCLIFVLSFLFISPTFGQEKLTEDEAAIKKVIEDETAHFNARDYDQWANCYVHSPITFYSWLSPSANKGALDMLQGWDNISKELKEYISTHPKTEAKFEKTGYQFKVGTDMAFVTFKENNNLMQSRVLEKVKGEWKILRMDASSEANFKKFRKLYDLQHLAGNWEVDMTTFKESSNSGWKLIQSEIEFKDVPTGLHGYTKGKYRTSNGELRTSEGLLLYTMNMTTNTIGAFNSVHYPQSNWSRAYQGQGDMDTNGKLIMEASEVGSDNKVKFSYALEGDRLHFELVSIVDDEEVYSSSYQMKRKGLVETTKP